MKYKSLPVEYKADGEGTVEAFVSVFGNVDSYGDRVMLGAFKESIESKLPKMVWQHDITRPIGKTILAEELPAGDARLPDSLKDYGALYVKGVFNLNTTDGKDAYEHIKFGSIDEYSFGYEEVETTPLADGTKELNKVNIIEWSPVTVGANPMTMTSNVKAMTLEEKLDVAATLIKQSEQHAVAYADMRSKAGRVLNSRIRGMILSLADQLKDVSKNLYKLHEETEPIQKHDKTEAKKKQLVVMLQSLNSMEII
jgi:HK97 family phage prohead protease